MRAAAPLADGFAPQIYWQNYPAPYMLEHDNLPPRPSRPYDPHRDIKNPAVYADLCLDWWRATVGNKPLILTGQAYWEDYPNHGLSQDQVEDKLAQFLNTFSGWSGLSGANWWHLGHSSNTTANGAMTNSMFETIVRARIHEKPFAIPAADIVA